MPAAATERRPQRGAGQRRYRAAFSVRDERGAFRPVLLTDDHRYSSAALPGFSLAVD